MPEPESTIPAPSIRESVPTEPRPWESENRGASPHPVKQWRRALMDPNWKIRWGSRAVLAAGVLLGAAGVVGAADSLLPIHPIDPGLVPQPTPGPEAVPPLAQ